LTVVRAALTTVMLAPLAIIVGLLAGVASVIFTGAQTLPGAGSWAAGWWVFLSPLRRMRGLEDQPGLEVDRAPGSGIPGQGGGELPDGAGTSLGY